MTSFDYLGWLQSILQSIRDGQLAAIQEAGRLVACSLAAGGVIQAFGSGHSHLIAEEAFFRAGGLAPVNPIFDARLQFFDGAMASTKWERELGTAAKILQRETFRQEDIGIVISNSGRNAAPVEMAEAMRSRGLKVIAITNLRQSAKAKSGVASGKRLFDVANLVIDTCCPEGDAVLQLPGLPHKIGPSSTVAGAAIMNSIMIEAALELLRQELPVPILPSANTADNDAELQSLLTKYSGRIRYFG